MNNNNNNTKTKKIIEEKKGGRKPKGGKIISKSRSNGSNEPPVANVILHLKCSLHDLEEYNKNYNEQLTDMLLYNPVVPPEIKTYNNGEIFFNYENNKEDTFSQKNFAYTNINNNNNNNNNGNTNNITTTNNNILDTNYICSLCSNNETPTFQENPPQSLPFNKNQLTNEINQKLKNLKIQLFKNKINEKKSACFWCTFDFDNTECYIPAFENDSKMYGYGSFCRPECAVAYLMKESIDDSIKFERYNLMNQIYGKIYNYTKNIKPSPNPYYLLDKFYGNLTIQEYRKLLNSEHLLMIVEKPLTRILPELHEENEEICYTTPTTTTLNTTTFHSGSNSQELQYKVKKSNEKRNVKTKTSIIREHFGLG